MEIPRTAYYESQLRSAAAKNQKLKYLNVQCTGLSGKPHPILSWARATQDIERLRISLKMVAGDYLCFAALHRDRGTDPQCRLCQSLGTSPAPAEDLLHILQTCRATAETRTRILPGLLNTVGMLFPDCGIPNVKSHSVLTQFILDPTSLNLENNLRLDPAAHHLSIVLSQCSNLCFAIHKERTRQLKKLGHIK